MSTSRETLCIHTHTHTHTPTTVPLQVEQTFVLALTKRQPYTCTNNTTDNIRAAQNKPQLRLWSRDLFMWFTAGFSV